MGYSGGAMKTYTLTFESNSNVAAGVVISALRDDAQKCLTKAIDAPTDELAGYWSRQSARSAMIAKDMRCAIE